jgi:hypothetical protein
VGVANRCGIGEGMQTTEQLSNGGTPAVDTSFSQDEYPHDQGDSTPAPKRDTMIPEQHDVTEDPAAQFADQQAKAESAANLAERERARLMSMADARRAVLVTELDALDKLQRVGKYGPFSKNVQDYVKLATEQVAATATRLDEASKTSPKGRWVGPHLRPAKAAKKSTRSHKGGRAGTAGIVEALLANVVALLSKSKTGMRSEEIQKALKLDKKAMPKVLKLGIGNKSLKKSGQKRATSYSAR